MVVPVQIGGSIFDYRPLRSEQNRLSKTLVLPSPRDKDDTAQVLEVEDDQTTPFKYPTFIKVRYDKQGDLPVFELWTRDNFDQEAKISKESLTGANPGAIGTSTQGINDDPLVAPANNFLSLVNNSFAVNPITGDIYRNAYWDHTTREIKNWNGVAEGAATFLNDNPGVAGNQSPQHVGTIKFDGVSGLALAAVNTRIADISNAVEGVTKILSVANGNLDSVLNLVR